MPFIRKCGKIMYSPAGYRWRYCAYALHAGHKTHSEYLLPFRCNNGCSNAPQRYVRTLSVLLYMLLLKKSSLQHVLAAAEPSFGWYMYIHIYMTVVRRCVWSRNLKTYEAMARVGPQRQKKKKKKKKKMCVCVCLFLSLSLSVRACENNPLHSTVAHINLPVYKLQRLC